MRSFIQKIISMVSRSPRYTMGHEPADEILDRHFADLRAVEPETREQWQRLQRAIAQQRTAPARIQHRLIPRLAFGAAVTVVLLAGAYMYFSPKPEPFQNYATGRGEQKSVLLTDGSDVTLNHTTRLLVRKLQAGAPRELSLTGEAYFRVQRNETPFIVSTNCAEVRVIGTEFNLRQRDNTLEVAVIHGTVRVSAVVDGRDSSILLSQHQMGVCPLGHFPRRIGNVPSAEYPGWMHGKLFLTKRLVSDACREIEMRFDVSITIDDLNLRNEVITGILDAGTPEAAVHAICEVTGRTSTHDGKTFTLH